jgi:hypothetical protein
MASPMKNRGYVQGLYAQSATAKEVLGTLRVTADGRKFRYSKAGAALAAGKLNVVEALDSTWVNEACGTASVGDKTLSLTITAAGAEISENQFRGGYLQICDGTAEGPQYLIESNTAVAASGTAITVGLAEPLREALTSASEFTLVSNPQWEVTQSTTYGVPAGVAPIDVTSAYFFWNQTGGVAPILCDASNPARGIKVMQSDITAGAVKTYATLSFLDVGYMLVTGVSGEYYPAMITIEK